MTDVMRSKLMNQKCVLNKVTVNKNSHKTMFCIELRKMLCSQDLPFHVPYGQ